MPPSCCQSGTSYWPDPGNKMVPFAEEKKMKGTWKKGEPPKQVWRFWELSLMKFHDIHSSGILKSWMDLNPSRILQKAPLELVSLAVLKWCVPTSHRVDSKIHRKPIKIYKAVLYSIHSGNKKTCPTQSVTTAIQKNFERKKKQHTTFKPQKRTKRLKLTWSQMNNMHNWPIWNPSNGKRQPNPNPKRPIQGGALRRRSRRTFP